MAPALRMTRSIKEKLKIFLTFKIRFASQNLRQERHYLPERTNTGSDAAKLFEVGPSPGSNPKNLDALGLIDVSS